MLLRRKRKCMIPIGRERAAENSCSLLPSLLSFPREWILYVNKCGGVGRKKCGQCHSKQVATPKNNQIIELIRKENTSLTSPPKWRQNAINYVASHLLEKWLRLGWIKNAFLIKRMFTISRIRKHINYVWHIESGFRRRRRRTDHKEYLSCFLLVFGQTYCRSVWMPKYANILWRIGMQR